jgi:hypothetical protein
MCKNDVDSSFDTRKKQMEVSTGGRCVCMVALLIHKERYTYTKGV